MNKNNNKNKQKLYGVIIIHFILSFDVHSIVQQLYIRSNILLLYVLYFMMFHNQGNHVVVYHHDVQFDLKNNVMDHLQIVLILY